MDSNKNDYNTHYVKAQKRVPHQSVITTRPDTNNSIVCN